MFLTFICLFIFSNIAHSKPYVPWNKEDGRYLRSSLPWKPFYDSFSWSRLIKKKTLSNDHIYNFPILFNIDANSLLNKLETLRQRFEIKNEIARPVRGLSKLTAHSRYLMRL